jgi:aminomethyltransferase
LALLALQGPKAVKVLCEHAPSIKEMAFMTAKQTKINEIDCLVTRSGYTGEDGFEISVSAKDAESLASLLIANDEVEWIGLGARDSLRLEAGLSLYGHELDISHSPVESSLNWALSKVRRLGGEREGNYLGDQVILNQLENGSDTKVVGILPEGKMPVRDGATIQDENGNQVGYVTSGGFGPTLNKPISIARIETKFNQSQSKLFALVRDKIIAVEIIKLPFVEHNYYRG